MIAPEFEIKDIKLAPSGHKKIDWVRKNCPLPKVS
jgi:S-adenosylhomocysteine hydrolase